MGENWPVINRDEDPGLLWEAEAGPLKSMTISPSTACHQHETVAKLISASSLVGFASFLFHCFCLAPPSEITILIKYLLFLPNSVLKSMLATSNTFFFSF